jgi:hypothetical protein
MNLKIFFTIVFCLVLSTAVLAAGSITISDPVTSLSGSAGQSVSGSFRITASADLIGVDVIASNFGAISSSAVSFSEDNFDMTSGSQKTITYTMAVPSGTDSGTYTGTITAAIGPNHIDSFGVTLTVGNTAMLAISDLDITVDDDDDNNVGNGDRIGEEAKPGSDIVMDFEIENRFTDDIEIENVEIRVEIDDLDIDEDVDVGDIRDGNDESATIEFDIPTDADGDVYDVEITVDGRDENMVAHILRWTIELEVERERNEVLIKSAYLTRSRVSCDPRTTTLNVKIENTGERDQNDAKITVRSNALGIDRTFTDIDIDSSDREEETVSIRVDDDLAPGTYNILVKSFYDEDRSSYDDVETVVLTVGECEYTTTTTTTDSATDTDGVAQATKIDDMSSIVKTTSAKAVTGQTTFQNFREGKTYVIVLIVAAVLIVLIAISLLVGLSRRE